MNLYSIKCLKFKNKKYFKRKCETDGKINLYYHCIECSFKKFEIIDKEELSGLLKVKL